MQRILSVYDWRLLAAEHEVKMTSDVEEQRLVRMRVNAPSPMQLWLRVPDAEDPIFLARVEGLDVIEFNIQGEFVLMAMGGEVWFNTLDGARADVEAVEPESFTTIVERKSQNQEMLLIERKMQENIERRMSALMGAMSATLAAKDAEIEAARIAAAAASTPAPQQDAGQVPSGEPAGQTSGGTGGEPNA